MKKEHATRIRRATLAAGMGAALAAGALLFVSDKDEGPTVAGPEARAMAAVGAGAPAEPQDLTALIRDREKWVRDHPKDERSWALLGTAYVDQGRRLADPAYYPKAERALLRSLRVRPANRGNVDAPVGLASLANARRDFTTARKWGEEVRARNPKQWTAYPVLIDAYSGLGDYEAAGKAHEKLKALRSGTPVLARSAEVYRDRGWREDAAAKATEAVSLATSPAEKAAALSELGELAWERGEPAEALGHYDAALETAPDHTPALAGRARAEAALGRTADAQKDYQAAIRMLPLPEYALELGELYDSLGLDGDARAQYATLRDRAARAQRNGVNEELLLGRYEADHGDPSAAVRRLKAEWGRMHRSVDVADALAWALYRSGQAEEALKYAKKATDQGTRSALFSYHRGEIERSLEMYGPARRHLEEALRIHPYFSPLLAPLAREVLDALGQPSDGGPQDMSGTKGDVGPDPGRPAAAASAPVASSASATAPASASGGRTS